MTRAVVTARCFAAALDADDYAAAEALLTADCEYITAKGTVVGPKPIIASYRGASEWARFEIQDVQYRSEVRDDGDGSAVITFIDQLRHNGLDHTYVCEQVIFLDSAGQICRIVHRELPGQKEALEGYFRSAGIARTP